MSTDTTTSTPSVVKDPRFLAGRTLVERGLAHQGAIDIFATLLEETTQRYGNASIETAPAYYEYGNALLRASASAALLEEAEKEVQDCADGAAPPWNTAAEAAEKRQQNNNGDNNGEEEDQDKKPAAIEQRAMDEPTTEEVDVDHEDDAAADQEVEEEEEEEDDTQLALTMMENAYSILDNYHDSNSNSTGGDDEAAAADYSDWVKDQTPRVLLGIGDTLSALGRHADAADAYSRSLELRQAILQAYHENDNTLPHLVSHRKVVEATVLIAEELLACPADQDVVTTETSALIVNKHERLSYARGYYDKARDALQEAVYFMGKLAAAKVELGREKEDVCFLATLVMGVGESLAAIDEELAVAGTASQSTEPVKKKPKR